VAAAEKALHDAHLDVLNVVNSDATLHGLATANGAQGFLAAPPAFANGVTAQNAPHADLAQIGAMFDDFVNHSLGGINASNAQSLSAEAKTMASSLEHLINANPDQFTGLTGVHAETIVRQLDLEQSFIHDAAHGSPTAGRASNDNILDIIDIVQGDDHLAKLANDGHVSGFTPFGDALNPTPKFTDNAAQTNFWANFIAQSNSLGDKAIQVVQSGDHAATGQLISDLMQFQNQVTKFDASQGPIFEARFDNELHGNNSTLGAEVSKMVEGLKAGNATLVTAAAQEMHANAMDVSGNNIPVNGGTYNPDGLTVASALSGATQVASAAPTPTVPTPVGTIAAPATTTAATPATPGAQDANHATPAPAAQPAVVDDHNAHMIAQDHGLAHLWG
jgi:uncharacterized protein YeaO (DUF488 family)